MPLQFLMRLRNRLGETLGGQIRRIDVAKLSFTLYLVLTFGAYFLY